MFVLIFARKFLIAGISAPSFAGKLFSERKKLLLF